MTGPRRDVGGARRPPLVAVVGPTASGKSDLAVALALELPGEVVNGDAMAVYRGMDTGTAKPTAEQRRSVPHHMFDVWPVTHAVTVAEFQQRAREVVADVRCRSRVPVLVGGSGQYVHAVVDDWDIPGTDAELRARLEAELAASGPRPLHDRLARLDPRAAAAILPTNGRRLVRALEVVELRGSFRATLPDFAARDDLVLLGLSVPRPELDARIAARVDRMWGRDLVGEVVRLEAAGLRAGRTASRALGYAQVLRFLAGECTEQEARDETVRATRRFARRQESWFRRDPRVRWLPYDDPGLVATALGVVAAAGSVPSTR